MPIIAGTHRGRRIFSIRKHLPVPDPKSKRPPHVLDEPDFLKEGLG